MRYVPEAYLFETIQEVIEALWDMYQKIETVILTESIGINGKNVFCFVFCGTTKDEIWYKRRNFDSPTWDVLKLAGT